MLNDKGNLLEEGIHISKEVLEFAKVNSLKISLKTGDYGKIVDKSRKKYNLELLTEVYELYASGNLFISDFYDVFDMKSPDRLREAFRNYKFAPLKNYRELYRDDIQSKTRNTNLANYGVDSPFKSAEVRNKILETFMEKYGVDNPSKSDDVKLKIRNTLTSKYGGIGNSVPSIKSKQKETMKSLYGVEHNWQRGKLRESQKETMKSLYGVEHNWQRGKLREALESKWVAKYGVDNPLKNPEVRLFAEDQFLEKYGDRGTFNHINHIHQNPRYNQVYNFKLQAANGLLDKEAAIKYIWENYSYTQALRLLKELKIKEPTEFTTEAIMQGLLNDAEVTFIKNAKKAHGVRYETGGYVEADFFIKVNENYSVAVEVNGIAHHSSNKSAFGSPKDPEYHINKRLLFQQNGIKLVAFMDFDVYNISKHQWIIDNILKAIQNPWNDEKLALMRNSSRDQYIVNSFEYDGWVYYDYGIFIGV